MLFGRVEVECWGVRAKGSGRARDKVGIGITGWGGVEAGESGKMVRSIGTVP